jgi:hypothetical protein
MNQLLGSHVHLQSATTESDPSQPGTSQSASNANQHTPSTIRGSLYWEVYIARLDQFRSRWEKEYEFFDN